MDRDGSSDKAIYKTIELHDKNNKVLQFFFDRAFDQDAQQITIFEEIKPFV